MASRPRAGRGMNGRDSGKDVDQIAEVHAQILEGVRMAKTYREKCSQLGSQIVALEDEITAKGGKPTTAERDRLDNLYREDVRYSEEEAKVLKEEPYGLINKMEIYRLLHAADEPPQARNPPVSKPRKLQRPATGESDAVVDSPGPSPNDARHDPLRKLKSASQRSSSVASAARVGISARSEDGGEALKGKHAERAGHFVIGAEVFYRHPKGALNPEGLGIQCIIKKVWQDRTQVTYDVQDPEPDESGRQDLHKATAADLIPIPQTGTNLPAFTVGKDVLARYPDTTTFYKATVMSIKKDVYKLRFEDDDKEMEVDKRCVLKLRESDSKV